MSEKGLLDELLASARKPEIGYGIHETCIVTSVSNKVKKSKDNVALKRNNYVVFSKLDKKGEIVAEKEISWFDIDVASEHAFTNFFNQLDQMVGILDCFYVKEEDEDIIADSFDKIFKEEEISSKEELEETVKDKKSFKKLMDSISANFEELLTPFTNSKKQHIRIKLSYDSKGKYLQQPKFDVFTESMSVSKEDSRLKMTKMEEEYKYKSLNPTTVSSTSVTNI